jgi:hypothetical protein
VTSKPVVVGSSAYGSSRDLDRAHGKTMIGKIVDGTASEDRRELRETSAQHHIVSRLERASFDEPLVDLHRLATRARIVDHRDADATKLAVCELNLILELCAADAWNLRRNNCLRPVDHHARGPTVSLPDDPPTCRIRRR